MIIERWWQLLEPRPPARNPSRFDVQRVTSLITGED